MQPPPPQPQQYPFYPPPDNQIRYDNRTAGSSLNPKSIKKKAKFCPICDFPANVRMLVQPCRHFMCYECWYIEGQTFCRFCNEIVKVSRRLDDVETFYSCDLETCFKYFENEAEYEDHMKLHQNLS